MTPTPKGRYSHFYAQTQPRANSRDRRRTATKNKSTGGGHQPIENEIEETKNPEEDIDPEQVGTEEDSVILGETICR